MKTSELTGAALDWAVAKCWYSDRRVELTEGKMGVRVLRDPSYDGSEHSHWFVFFGSDNWAQGGPIIEKQRMDLNPHGVDSRNGRTQWRAAIQWLDEADFEGIGSTPLIAAMRCYVASKLGDEVEIPKELA